MSSYLASFEIYHTCMCIQALAELAKRLKPQGRKVTVVTQNIDGLHHQAGSEDVIELHGQLSAL